MRPRSTVLAFVLATLSTACGGEITAPSAERLTSIVMAGPYACGLDADGRAYCWGGYNGSGELGDGTNTPSTSPVRVSTSARFTQVVVGESHACGLDAGGRAFCWGNNGSSQLGVTTTDLDCRLLQPNGWLQDFGNACSTIPVLVQTERRFVQLGAASWQTCGLTAQGEIWCWGESSYGFGNIPNWARSDSLIRVASTRTFVTIAIGEDHSCASARDGQGYCWGFNNLGQSGRVDADSVSGYVAAPAPIFSLASIRRWALGSSRTCALTSAGEALCWGLGSSGERGDSSTVRAVYRPTAVKTGLRFTEIAAAGAGSCALESGTGAAWCWGENSEGELGDGTTVDRLTPTRVLGRLSFQRLVMGTEFPDWGTTTTCGSSGGEFYCWGLLPRPLTFGE